MKGAEDLAVFVYGTLKPGGSAWARLCEGRVVEQQRARVRGRLFALKPGFPAVMLAPGDAAYWVRGWRLVLRDAAALRGFDAWEEYDPQRAPEKNIYQRARVACFSDEDAPAPLGEAWIYVMDQARIAAKGGVELPGGEWTEPAE